MRKSYVYDYCSEFIYLTLIIIDDYYDIDSNVLSFGFTDEYKYEISKINNKSKITEYLKFYDFFCHLYVNAYIVDICNSENNKIKIDKIKKYLELYCSRYYEQYNKDDKSIIILNKIGV